MPLLTLPQATIAQATFPTSGVHSARWAVEFSPTTNPAETPVWVDVTSRVRGLTTKRGRQRLLDRFETGTATIVLDNRDRAFDPSYTSGPYYGNLLPMRRWRIRAQYPDGTATFHRFNGYASAYRQQYDKSDNDATCVVELADAFKVLALTKPTSPWAAQVQALDPDGWYRLSESEANAGLRDSAAAGNDGTYSGSPTMLQTGLVDADDNACVSFSGGAYARVGQSLSVANGGGSLGLWFAQSSATAQTLAAWTDPNGNTAVEIGLTAAGALVFSELTFPAGPVRSIFTTNAATYDDGLPHYAHVDFLFALDQGSGGYVTVLFPSVDGVAYMDSPSSYTVTTSSTLPAGNANTLTIAARPDASQPATAKIDEVVVWTTTVTPSQSLLFASGSAPYASDPTGTRVGRVLSLVGWPTGERDLDTGNSTLQAASFTGSALDHLLAVALTEQGQFFHGADGRIVFRERHSTIGAASSYTFTDDAGSGVRFSGLTFSYDDTLIRNAVIAQRDNGGEVTVNDPSSVAAYYERTYRQSGLLYEDDSQTRDFAQWIVNRFKDPALRVQSMTVFPEANPAALYPAVLGLELGALVTVTRTPMGVGNTITRDVIVEGIAETYTPSSYEVTFAISEADTSAYWVIGDATYGVLGVTTRLAF